jgi:hypothetical protein
MAGFPKLSNAVRFDVMGEMTIYFRSSPIFSHFPMDYKPIDFSVELVPGVNHNDL